MNKKYVFSGLILGAVLAIVLVIIIGPYSNPNLPIVESVEPTLPQESIEFVENRLAETQAAMEAFDETTTFDVIVSHHVAIGNDHIILGDYLAAKDAYEMALEVNPDNSFVWQTYSSLLWRMGDWKGAINAVDQSLELNPKTSESWIWKIELEKVLLKDISKLEGTYRDAINSTQAFGEADIRVSFAEFLQEQGEIDRAIAQYEEVLTLVQDQDRTRFEQLIEELQGQL